LEQPLDHDDLIYHVKLRKEVSTPICLDESISSPDKARNAFEIGAVDVVNIKPGRMGGLINSLEVARIVRNTKGHVWIGGMLETGVGRSFNIALASHRLVDYPGDTSPNEKYFHRDIVRNPFVMRDGIIEPNTWPALESRISRLREQSEAEHGQRENAKKTPVEILQPMYERRTEKLQDPVLLKGLDSTASRLLEILTLSKDVIFLVKKAIKVKDAMKRYLETALLEGRRVRIIFPSGAKLTPDDIELTKKLGVEVAWHDNPLLDMMVADEADVMLGVPDQMSEEPFGAIVVWIRNESFARSTRETPDAIWKSSSRRPKP